MAYAPFKIPKSDSPLATLATVATLDPTRPQSVANVASVARGERENNASTPRSVATVASVARHIPKTENPAPVSLDPVAEPEPPEAAVARFDSEIEMTVPAGADPWETARRLIDMAGEMAEPGRRYLIQLFDDDSTEGTRH